MKILQIFTAAAVLVTSTSAMAWWGPFDNDDDRYGNRGNNSMGTITAGTIAGMTILWAILWMTYLVICPVTWT